MTAATTVSRLTKLIEAGVSENDARHSVAQAQRERLLSRDIIIGGALELADDMPEAQMALHPCLVHGHLLTFTARPGDGKSTLTMSLASAFVLDRELGPFVRDDDSAGLVYYVSAEDFTSTGLRIQAEAVRYRLTKDERMAFSAGLRWVHINTTPHPSVIAEEMRRDADGRRISLVIVDTGPALFAGDNENDNAQLQDFAVACRAFVQLPGGPCTLVNWHPAKGATADNLLPRGGSALTASVDGNLTLWRDDDVLTLGYTKFRGGHFDPIRLELQRIPLLMPSGRHVDIPVASPLTDDKADQRDAGVRDRRERILLALSAGERVTLRELAKQALGDDGKRSTVQRDLADMMRAKPALIEQDPIGHGYSLTAAGRRQSQAARVRTSADYRDASRPQY